jgi:hypothetical protein
MQTANMVSAILYHKCSSYYYQFQARHTMRCIQIFFVLREAILLLSVLTRISFIKGSETIIKLKKYNSVHSHFFSPKIWS